MRRVQWIMAALAALLGVPAEAATTIQLTVTGTYSTHHDGATGTVETFAPRAFTAVATCR
ncbi:hypothetical protein ACMGDM_17325 [Sphingomonas sp. DT-51]|uniref:hypothetical protein n=1 Tax=Sphingomonas sp. DT-51 TaxID=3396165 RepID=UPI003F1A1BFE